MGTEYYLSLLIICAMFLEGIMASDEKLDESAIPHIRQKRITTPQFDNPHNLALYNPTRVLITSGQTSVQVGYAIHPFIVVTWAQAFYNYHHPALKVAEHVPNRSHFLYRKIIGRRVHPDFIPHQGHNENDVIVLRVEEEIFLRPHSERVLFERFGDYIEHFILPQANNLVEEMAG